MSAIKSPAIAGGMSIGYGALLGAVFLPGLGLFWSVPLGALGMFVLRSIEWPDAWRAWIASHRLLLTLGGFLIGMALWPVAEDDIVRRGFLGALPVFVAASLLGASHHGAPDRNVGAILGLLIGGAFGGPIRAVLGCAIGAGVGWLTRRSSGITTGMFLGPVLAALLTTPSCAGYGIDLTTTTISGFDQWSDYMDAAAYEASERGVAMSVMDLSMGPGSFADQEEFSFIGFVFAWLFGLAVGGVFGTMLGQLAKSRGVDTFETATSPPSTEAMAPAPTASLAADADQASS